MFLLICLYKMNLVRDWGNVSTVCVNRFKAGYAAFLLMQTVNNQSTVIITIY